MYMGDALGYLAFGNPISQALAIASTALKSTGLKPKSSSNASTDIALDTISMWKLAGGNYNFVRLAGLSGAAAVVMGAYGKKSIERITDAKDYSEARAVFETANRYHFLHTFALMAIPLARKPALTGTLMAIGTILFSGPMYYRVLTGDKTYIKVATCGGFCLIAAWLTFIL